MIDPASGLAAAPTERPTYWWIQYLRGFAAAGVVIYHVYDNFPVPTGRAFEIGARGVDVFFVISGFIMYTAARDERFIQFVTRRLIRVFPLYWLATAIALIVFFWYFGSRPSGTEAVLSLALVPHYSESHPDKIWPILVPGWTLSYEMFFYALFALGIAARRVVAMPMLAIAVLVALGAAFKPQIAPLVVVTNPRLIEFLLGMLIALALHRRAALMPGIVVASLAVALAGMALGSDDVMYYAGSAFVVSGALWLERRRPGPPILFLRLLGDASYSIYLFHTPFLLLFYIIVVSRFAALSSLQANALAVVAMIFALAVGVLLHLALEKPVLRILNGWNRRFLARYTPTAPLPA